MQTTIDIESSVAVYAQIENHIQFAISSGRLKAHERLPSVRELSERLKVNLNTVAKAYRDLEVMGLLYTRRGMGVFVNEGVAAKCQEDCRKRIIAKMHEVTAEARAAGMTAAEVTLIAKKCLTSNAGPYGATPPAILALAKKHGEQRLNRVCKRANQFATSSLKSIKSMIDLDLEEQHSQRQLIGAIPEHENIRGTGYYH